MVCFRTNTPETGSQDIDFGKCRGVLELMNERGSNVWDEHKGQQVECLGNNEQERILELTSKRGSKTFRANIHDV